MRLQAPLRTPATLFSAACRPEPACTYEEMSLMGPARRSDVEEARKCLTASERTGRSRSIYAASRRIYSVASAQAQNREIDMFDWFTELSGFLNFVIGMLTVNMILLIQIRKQLWAETITITTAVSRLTISLDMTSNRYLVNGSTRCTN